MTYNLNRTDAVASRPAWYAPSDIWTTWFTAGPASMVVNDQFEEGAMVSYELWRRDGSQQPYRHSRSVPLNVRHWQPRRSP